MIRAVSLAGALFAGSVAPANAFAVAQAPENSVPVNYSYVSAPALSYVSYEQTVSPELAPMTEATQTIAPLQVSQSPTSSEVTLNPSLKDNASLTERQKTVLSAAYSGIGGSYVWGGKNFKSWDCSGYVSWVYKQAGVNLTAYTYAMKNEVVPTSNPQPGDIVFTNNYAHVGIYIGDGKMISALNPSQGTIISDVDGGGLMPVDGYYTVAN